MREVGVVVRSQRTAEMTTMPTQARLAIEVQLTSASAGFAIRYSTRGHPESARKHGVSDDDILHAIDFALVAAEQDDGKVLYLGPDKSGNLLEVVTVRRDDATEIVIHAMKMRTMYEPLLREMGGTDD